MNGSMPGNGDGISAPLLSLDPASSPRSPLLIIVSICASLRRACSRTLTSHGFALEVHGAGDFRALRLWVQAAFQPRREARIPLRLEAATQVIAQRLEVLSDRGIGPEQRRV